MSDAPRRPEHTDFDLLEATKKRWSGHSIGFIATVTGMNRTRVKRAFKWATENRHDIVVEGPTSSPNQLGWRIVEAPTSPSLKRLKWHMQYAETRQESIAAEAEQQSATATDPILAKMLQMAASKSRASAVEDGHMRDLIAMYLESNGEPPSLTG